MTRLHLAIAGLLCVLMALGLRATFKAFDDTFHHVTDRARMGSATAGDDEFAPVHAGETARV